MKGTKKTGRKNGQERKLEGNACDSQVASIQNRTRDKITRLRDKIIKFH